MINLKLHHRGWSYRGPLRLIQARNLYSRDTQSCHSVHAIFRAVSTASVHLHKPRGLPPDVQDTADDQCLRLDRARTSPHAPPLQAPLLAALGAARALQALLAAARACQVFWPLRTLFAAPDAADHMASAGSSFGQVISALSVPDSQVYCYLHTRALQCEPITCEIQDTFRLWAFLTPTKLLRDLSVRFDCVNYAASLSGGGAGRAGRPGLEEYREAHHRRPQLGGRCGAGGPRRPAGAAGFASGPAAWRPGRSASVSRGT